MNEASWIIAIATAVLAVLTGGYVVLTWKIAKKAAHTAEIAEKSARYTVAVEFTHLSMEENWRLWEHRNYIRTPVASEDLTEEDWAWRLPLLNHLNLLLLAWRGREIGVIGDEELDSWVAKAKMNMSKVRKNHAALHQFQLLLRHGEGFPDQFRRWMYEREIVLEEDSV